MIKRTALYLILAATISACNSGSKSATPQSMTDVATAFIQSTLKNDSREARKYILPDEQNEQTLQEYERWYERQNEKRKKGFQNSEIIVEEIETVVADSLEIFYYHISVEPTRTKLKLVRSNNRWLVDFKYTTSGNL